MRLYVHQLELDRTSNTGWLVAEMVQGVSVAVHGRGAWAARDGGPRRSRALVLHPDGRPLRRADAGDDLELLVPDATWAQARRMLRRVPALRDAEAVRVEGGPSFETVRRGGEGQLCTGEAVARALAILGDDGAAQALQEVLGEWLERALLVRRGGPVG